MRLYMTELAVADLAASLHFYRDRLGLPVELLDEANGFTLLHAGGRLALKQAAPVGRAVPDSGQPMSGAARPTATVHLEVADLDAELQRLGEAADIKASDEGYRRAVLHDPDGHRVVLFQWVGR